MTTHRTLFTILLISLILRAGWVLKQPRELNPTLNDQSEYLQLAQNLLTSHELKFFDPRFNQNVYAYRTPGYPAFVAACGANISLIRIAQALIDTSTALAIYLLGLQLGSRRAALIAAALVAFNPFLIYFTGLILSETFFVAMLAWGMFLLIRQRGAGWHAWAGAVLLALSVLVRPSAIGLVILLAGAAAWPRGWRAVLLGTARAAILVAATLLPWAWRNAHHPIVHAWVWTTTNSGITTYDGFHDAATGASNQAAFVAQLKPLLSHMDEVERDDYLNQKAHEWIQQHPGKSLRLMAVKAARTWSPIPLSDEYGGRWLYVVVGMLFALPFQLLVLLGIWKSDLPRALKVFCLLPAIYFTVIHALSVGSLRYRMPAEPPMAIVAGSWASYALGTKYAQSRRES